MDERAVPPPPFLSRIREELRVLGTVLEAIDEALGRVIEGEQIVAHAELGSDAESDESITEGELAFFESLHVEELGRRFGTPLYFSFLLLIAATLESWVMRLCRYIGEQRQIPIGVNKLSGPDLERARTYLTRLAKWPFPSDETWSWVQDFFEVRNCIAHWGGRFSELPHGDLKSKLKDFEGISRRRPGIWVEGESETTIADLLAENGLEESEAPTDKDHDRERRLLEVSLVVEHQFCVTALEQSKEVLEVLCSEWSKK